MKRRDLVIHLPVIHKGYLTFFNKAKKEIDTIYVLDESFLKILVDTRPDIASLNSSVVAKLLTKMGFKKVSILNKQNINKLKDSILLVNDETSRNLSKKFLAKKDIKWSRVFLRWDKSSVTSSPVGGSPISNSVLDKKMMEQAYKEGNKSSDWWRMVGAVLVIDGEIVLRAYNRGMPSDHTPYQMGAIRDFLGVGQKPELSSTIHAEQTIIALAAKKGLSLEGSSLYVTHFPCPVCAKLIALSGIKRCYFGEGSSTVDGKAILKSKGVKIALVKVKNSQTIT